MNMHDAVATLIYTANLVPLALAFWLTAEGVQRVGEIREARHNRRLDRRAKREIRKQFNRITGQSDGIERP